MEIIAIKDYGNLRACTEFKMTAVASIRRAKAAEKFRAGRARHPYVIRKEVIQGTAAEGIGEENTTGVCTLYQVQD